MWVCFSVPAQKDLVDDGIFTDAAVLGRDLCVED